jgi:hypothetical protein
MTLGVERLMNNYAFFLRAVFMAIVFSVPLVAQRPAKVMPTLQSAASSEMASPEMDKLAKVLVGDWNTVEIMERGEFFPAGGSRHGAVRVRLAAGGNVLIYKVHSNGSAGKLDGFHTIWWDKGANLYYFFACFNNPGHPCRMRGTAHWEGDAFVNDYEETVDGKKTQCRDSFTFTATSHTLVAATDIGNGVMKTVITTRATRR